MVSNIPSTNYLDKAKNSNNSQKSYSTSYLKEQPKQDMVEISTPKRAQKAKKFKAPQKSAPFDWKMALAIGGCIIAGAAMIRGGLPRFNVGGKSQKPVEELKNLVFENISENKKVKNFSEISGLDGLKSIVGKIKQHFDDPNIIQNWGLESIQTRYLLYGPPGTGKTTIAQAIAKELNADFTSIAKTDFDTCMAGEAPKRFIALMDQIKAHAQKNPKKPIVVLMDEIDSIIATDTSNLAAHSEGLGNAFKTKTIELERECPNVFIFGTTNKSIGGSATDNKFVQINSAITNRFSGGLIEVERPKANEIKDTLMKEFKKITYLENDLYTEKELETISQAFEDMALDYREIIAIVRHIKDFGSSKWPKGKNINTQALKEQIARYFDKEAKRISFDEYLQQPKDKTKFSKALNNLNSLFNNLN